MRTAGFLSRATRTATLVGGLVCVTAPAFADCNADIAGLSQKRQVFIDKLNVLAKSTKGKLDPVSSCPVLRSLTVAEGKLLSYLETNKNWCNVPDNVVDNLKGAAAKSQTFAAQACNIAAQAKKQQQQQASGASLGVETQKLPAGPL
jgi:hypothetical protein